MSRDDRSEAEAAARADYEARSIAEIERGHLPLRAQERLAAMTGDEAFTSDLSVAEHHAVRTVGFEPVGQVMGTSVFSVGYTGMWDCGYRGYGYGGMNVGFGGGGVRPIRGPNALGRPGGFAGGGMPGGFGGPLSMGGGVRGGGAGIVEADALVRARMQVQKLALGRMIAEAQALGGDGIVAVRLTVSEIAGAGTVEWNAIGTAIRATGSHHVAKPFTSALSGQDFSLLLRAGWVPTNLAAGISVKTRHDDYRTTWQNRSYNNVELDGYSELMHEARSSARLALARDVAAHGAEGVVLHSVSDHVSEHECRLVEGQRDHVVEASFLGTGVARLSRGARPAAPAALTILSLSDRSTRLLATP